MRFFSICSHPIKGNAYLIEKNETQILLDAGFTKTLLHQTIYQKRIDIQKIKALFLSHSHDPHVKGLKFLLEIHPNIEIYALKETFDSLEGIDIQNQRIIEERNPIIIDDLTIYPFPVKHFIPTLNFTVGTNEEKIAYITNTGNIEKRLIDDIGKCQHFLIEAYYHPGLIRKVLSWEEMKHIVTNDGHLTNEDATEIVGRCFNPKIKHVVLCNMSKYNRPLISKLLMESVFSDIDDVKVELAPPEFASHWYESNEEEQILRKIKRLPKAKQQELISHFIQ